MHSSVAAVITVGVFEMVKQRSQDFSFEDLRKGVYEGVQVYYKLWAKKVLTRMSAW